MIVFIATRKNKDAAGRQVQRDDQHGGPPAAALQHDRPQAAYGQASTAFNNPTFANASDAVYEEIADDYEMPDGFDASGRKDPETTPPSTTSRHA